MCARRALAMAVLLGLALPIGFTRGADAGESTATHSWVFGGQATLGFNPDALAALGLRIDSVQTQLVQEAGRAGHRYATMQFAATDDSGLEVLRDGAVVRGLGDGALRFRGGALFRHAHGSVDLRGFALRAQPSTRTGIDIVDAHGAVWLTADHAHYGFASQSPGRFAMRHMNLRLSARFADALGRPELAGYPIGTLDFDAAMRADDRPAATDANGVCDAPWPASGLTTDIELMDGALSGFDDTIYAPRCGLPPLPDGGACTASSTNGKLVLGADASLRNIGQTAIPWHAHFSGEFPPYGNDQHPYLIWNLYRVDANGRIKQIGVSGVKHAFYSINQNCGCPDGHVIWPGCEDVYSLASNDNGGGMQNLAPRSEIVPFDGRWGRCGSVWDADCDGQMDSGSGAQDLYQYRMLVDESDLLPPLADGARYYFEYWYVVRDDTNVYNSMGYREIALHKTGANWSVELVGIDGPDHDFHLGPVIDAWVAPSGSSADAVNRELATPLGRARIAVTVTALDDGRWRYRYAVMNIDYAHAQIDPAHPDEPDMRLLSNHGFSRFSVPLPAGVPASDLRFMDADGNSANDWIGTVGDRSVAWTAPAGGNTLDWGTLYMFEFVASAPPGVAALGLVGASTASEPGVAYTLSMVAPGDLRATPPEVRRIPPALLLQPRRR